MIEDIFFKALSVVCICFMIFIAIVIHQATSYLIFWLLFAPLCSLGMMAAYRIGWRDMI